MEETLGWVGLGEVEMLDASASSSGRFGQAKVLLASPRLFGGEQTDVYTRPRTGSYLPGFASSPAIPHANLERKGKTMPVSSTLREGVHCVISMFW